MIEKKEDALVFAFPEVHSDARCTVVFQRTLRLPEGGRNNPLPPGLGRYRISSASAFQDRMPGKWRKDSMLIPMYQSEALLVIFIGWYPCAVKVTYQGRNAITGRKSADDRLWRPKDYVTFPQHPWMEWFCLGRSEARQFVASPLDEKSADLESSEITVAVHPMKSRNYEVYRARRAAAVSGACSRGDTGLPGNSAWETTSLGTCTVYPVNTSVFREITGQSPEGNPPGREDYVKAGLPWKKQYSDLEYLPVPEAAVC